MRAFLSKYRQYAALVLAALLVGIDQLTKWLVVSNMEMYNVVPLIKIDGVEVLNLFYCTNNANHPPEVDAKTYTGPAWLGIDAGSTTTKLALITADGGLLYT